VQTENDNGMPPTRPKSRQYKLLIGLVAGVVGGNLLAFIFLGQRPAPAPAVAPKAEVAPAPAASPAADDGSALARAKRISGLQALEAGDYDLASAEFTQALRLGGGGSDLPQLLEIAKNLQERSRRPPAAVAVPAPAPAPEESREVARRASAAPARPRTPPSRGQPGARQPARPEEAEARSTTGLLLVTSTPSGLVVEVDGRSLDLTPTRLTLPVGAHRVALLSGSRRVAERSVSIEADEVRALNEDVEAKLAELRAPSASATAPQEAAPAPILAAAERAAPPDPASAAPASAAPAPAAPAPVVPAPAAPAPAAPAPVAPAPAPSRSPAPAPARAAAPDPSRGRGELEVISPNVLGEIWIGGRSFGYPPRIIKDMPAGDAAVEIRAGGTVRRAKTVTIKADERTRVRFQ
jgi:hypothetical protein